MLLRTYLALGSERWTSGYDKILEAAKILQAAGIFRRGGNRSVCVYVSIVSIISGVHNAKAEECTTPIHTMRIYIDVGGLLKIVTAMRKLRPFCCTVLYVTIGNPPTRIYISIFRRCTLLCFSVMYS